MKTAWVPLVLGLFATSALADQPLLAGVWKGTAYDTHGDATRRHETELHIGCNIATGSITYKYPALSIKCNSTLALQSSSGNNWTHTWNYDDHTLSTICIDGKVRLKWSTLYSNSLQFQWLFPDGTVDTEGTLVKVSSYICPP